MPNAFGKYLRAQRKAARLSQEELGKALRVSGAYVSQVVPGTPAAEAGMQNGSVITSINGHAITSAKDVSDVMHATKPGDTADVTWVDVSGSHSASVQLITAPAV